MKNYSLLLFPIVIATLLGSCGIAVFSLAIIIANSLAGLGKNVAGRIYPDGRNARFAYLELTRRF